MNTKEYVAMLLSQPDKLLKKKPFYRKITDRTSSISSVTHATVNMNSTVTAELPKIQMEIVSQAQFMRELDVYSHRVLFDDNVPAITIKSKENGFLEIEQYRMAVPFQVLIRDKQVRHLCVNTMCHTLLNTEPTDVQQANFIRFKQAWAEKNMEGAKTKLVQDQKSYGDAALLFFMDDGILRTQNINYGDGYVIITHKADSGKHVLECLYYSVTDDDGNTITYLDCYDDQYMTRFTNQQDDASNTTMTGGWMKHEPVLHGFSEIPLITKRGEVAWNRGQRTIESYEALYNTFIVIQKRHGWGALYIKGKFNSNGQKIAGAVVLNDTTSDPAADAKYLNPPAPQNIIETLELMEQTIQKSTGTTFILPKDIKISGDTSGLAVEMTQELDMATAQDGVIEWQNVANKMSRLFKEGIAKELVKAKENEFAVTQFQDMHIYSEFRVWKPKSEEAHNQMLATLKGAGGISQQTLVEKNTVSTPDELMRIQKEHEAEIKEAEAQERKKAELAQQTAVNATANE